MCKCARGTHEDQMEVIPHQAPRENRPAVEVPNVAQRFYELDRLVLIVENELTASDAAVNVIRSSGNEEARLSRHEIAPMHGRDTPILLTLPHNATMRNVAPM